MKNLPTYDQFLNEMNKSENPNIINIKSQTDLSGFHVVFNGSTLNEKPGWFGLSHLMEHLICKNFDHLMDEFDKDGIGWNAYTANDKIVFYLTGLDEYVNKHKSKFLDLLCNFNVTEEMLENEKKIVIEEYLRSFNDQLHANILNSHRKLFNYYNPIGLRKDIENTTLKDCKEFFELQFQNPSKIVNVSKYNLFNEDIKLDTKNIDKQFSYIKEINESTDFYEAVDFTKNSTIVYMSPIVNDKYYLVDFATDLLSVGLKSPLINEIREKRGLTYAVDCWMGKLSDSSGLVHIGCQTSKDKLPELQDTVYEIFKNPKKYISKERFENIKQWLEINKRKSEINRYARIEEFITPESWDTHKNIDKITYDEIISMFDEYLNIDEFFINVDNE